MNRRDTVLALLALCAAGRPLALQGQSSRRYRVGLLSTNTEAGGAPYVEAMLAGMRDHGYVIGQGLDFDIRYAEGDRGRYAALADELIALKPDVLVGVEEAVLVMKQKTGAIPIVVTSSWNPVASGLVNSLARPGTNVTGLSNSFVEILGKQLELMLEILPKMRRIAYFALAPLGPRVEMLVRYEAAKGLSAVRYGISDIESVRQAFAEMEKQRPDVLVVVASGVTAARLPQILDGARKMRLPAICSFSSPVFAEKGGLVSYGVDYVADFRYAMKFVDRILRGAKPGDLPVEQTNRFELVVNGRVARELGITIPQSVVLRADRVIE
jgi:putative ABC transport system substrate-binding protein